MKTIFTTEALIYAAVIILVAAVLVLTGISPASLLDAGTVYQGF